MDGGGHGDAGRHKARAGGREEDTVPRGHRGPCLLPLGEGLAPLTLAGSCGGDK